MDDRSDQSARAGESPLFEGLLDHEREPVRGILVAAEKCFRESGYGGTGIRQIAEAAAVSKSLLHYHFQSKEHVFLEVQIAIYNRLAAQMAAAMQPRATSAERGLFAVDALFASLRQSSDLAVQAEIWARALTNEKLRARVVKLREYMRDLIVRTIEGVLGPAVANLPVSVETAADLVWAMFWGLGLQAAFDADRERVDRTLAGVRQVIAMALRPGVGETRHDGT